MAETSCLLNNRAGSTPYRGSNPSSATSKKYKNRDSLRFKTKSGLVLSTHSLILIRF